MIDFVKTIILVAIFYALILFSFAWFNKGENDLRSVPYVQEFFEMIEIGTEWMGNNTINQFDFNNVFKPKDRDIENLLPVSTDDWENFLKK